MVAPRAIIGGLALALASGWAEAAAPPAPPTAPAAAIPADVLRVDVEPGIDDAALLRGWIADRHPGLPEALRDPGGTHAQGIAVRIAGSTYDYRVSVTAVRDGEPLGPNAEPTRCECTIEELLEQVDAGIEAAIEQLQAPAPSPPAPSKPAPLPAPPAASTPEVVAPAPSPEPSTREPSPVRQLDPRSSRLGPLGHAGVGVAVAGAGLSIAGIVLAVRPTQIRGEPGDVEIRDFRGGGLGVAVSGGVVLATGVALLVVDRVTVRRRATAWVPVLRPGMVGVSIARRF